VSNLGVVGIPSLVEQLLDLLIGEAVDEPSLAKRGFAPILDDLAQNPL